MAIVQKFKTAADKTDQQLLNKRLAIKAYTGTTLTDLYFVSALVYILHRLLFSNQITTNES
jgi:hypothetical protein